MACMGQGSCGVVMKLLCCSYRTFLRSQKWIPRQSFRECLCGEVFVHAFIKFLFIFLIHLWAKKQHIKVSQFEMCPETHLDDGFRGIDLLISKADHTAHASFLIVGRHFCFSFKRNSDNSFTKSSKYMPV